MDNRKEQLITEENLARRDFKVWISLIFMCCFGLVIIYSASAYECSLSESMGYESMYLLIKQLKYEVMGFIFIFFLQFYNFNMAKSPFLSNLLYWGSIGMILLLRTSLGISANGAARWLRLGPVQFQVAEVVKVGVIFMLAYLYNEYSKRTNGVVLAFFMWAAGGLPAALLFKISNDLSSALVVAGITFGCSLVCTRAYKSHIAIGSAAIVGCVMYVYRIAVNLPTQEELDNLPFRIGRIAAWLAPERYASKQGYQILQSQYAIGSGGILGKGLGNSVQKLSAIPEAQNDMIFSIICEELGIVGAIALLALFAYLLYQIFRIAMTAENAYLSILTMGVFFHIGLQVIINIAVNVNLFPNTGLALPFISYGGTAVFCMLAEMSIVIAIERRSVYFREIRNEKARMRYLKLKKQ